MNNQIFDSFDRTEFSDEVFAIFGRVLTVATRFDTSAKALARLPLFKASVGAKDRLSDDEYEEMVQNINNRYKNLNRAIQALKLDEDIGEVLRQARESRNELIHESTLRASKGFDHMDTTEFSQLINHVEGLVLQIIRAEAIISTIATIQNKEIVSDFLLSKEYEAKYINWVMERFEK